MATIMLIVCSEYFLPCYMHFNRFLLHCSHLRLAPPSCSPFFADAEQLQQS
jgi:hypothetical protein